MTADELYEWLLNTGVGPELTTLMRHTVRSEIDNLLPESKILQSFDWSRILFAGSILARSDQRQYLEAALRIATGAMLLSSDQLFKDAAAVLMTKLSNFRTIQLAHRRHLIGDSFDDRLGVSLRLEVQRRKIDDSVLIESTGKRLQVNDFQRQFWESANSNDWLSASAPTAAGKTYLVSQWLVDQVRSGTLSKAIYLAPTRALVSEIESSLRSIIGENSNISVSSLPLRSEYNSALGKSDSVIFILTQERIHLLANAMENQLSIDLLIVDEAHKIGDNQRGVILQDAVERIGRTNKNLRIVFISPATQNPEELLRDSPENVRSFALNSDSPTVIQNLILAEQVPRKPKEWRMSLRHGGTDLPIGTLCLKSSPSTAQKRLAFIAAVAGERGGTLVYANGAADAENIADLISQMIAHPAEKDQELVDLADLSRKTIHPGYRLAPLVETGVAFHYGNMPSIVRLEIERLFRVGKIKFLVCTSTLIEGVNLSCRTIVLRGPRKGLNRVMAAHDFWNLAGRAGRWGDEFQGNIICIEPRDQVAWPNGIPGRSRYPIRRESDAVISLGDALVTYIANRSTVDLTDIVKSERYEQVSAYLISQYLRYGSVSGAGMVERHEAGLIHQINAIIGDVVQNIQIDAALAERHPGVSAIGLQRLLEFFRNYAGDIENLLPAPAESVDSYDRLVTVMTRINKNLFPAFSPDQRTKLYALIVIRWLKGYSLSAMIRESILYHRRNGREFRLPGLIRETMELVEQIARFKAPRYIAAYVDVLHFYLRSIGREDLIEDGIDIGTQLEFGLSSKTMLSLTELGLSRTSAVSLYEKIARDDLNKIECVEWVTSRIDRLEQIDVPAIVLREIKEKLIPRANNGDSTN